MKSPFKGFLCGLPGFTTGKTSGHFSAKNRYSNKTGRNSGLKTNSNSTAKCGNWAYITIN